MTVVQVNLLFCEDHEHLGNQNWISTINVFFIFLALLIHISFFIDGFSAKTSSALDNLFLLLNFLNPELEALSLGS